MNDPKMSLKSAMMMAMLQKKGMLMRRGDHPEKFQYLGDDIEATIRVSGIDIRRKFGAKNEERIRLLITRIFYDLFVQGHTIRHGGTEIGFVTFMGNGLEGLYPASGGLYYLLRKKGVGYV